MIIKHLEKVKERSDVEKKRFAFFWAIVGTSLVALFWFFNLGFILSGVGKTETVVAQPKGELVKSEKPEKSWWATAKELLSYFQEAVDSVAVGSTEATAKFKNLLNR